MLNKKKVFATLTVIGVASLSFPSIAYADQQPGSDPSQHVKTITPGNFDFYAVNIQGMVPGDVYEVPFSITKEGNEKARLRYGYFQVQLNGADPESNAFYDDVYLTWEDIPLGPDSVRSLERPFDGTYDELDMVEFAANGTENTTLSKLGIEYNASSNVVPPRDTAAGVGILFFMNAVVDPVGPTTVDNPGYNNDSATVPANTNCIEYSNFLYNQSTGAWSLTATAKEGCEFEDESVKKNLSGSLDISKLKVTPQIVTSNDSPGWLDDTVTAPEDTDQIKYTLTYTQSTGEWTLVATTKDPNIVFPDGETTNTETGKLNVDPILVTGENPVIVDETGYENDSVTFPTDTKYIDYTGTYDQNTGKWVQKATTLREDVIFSNNNTGNWETSGNLDVEVPGTDTPPEATVTPGTVTISDTPGWLDDTTIAPEDTEDIHYELEYNQTTGKWTLTATIVGENKTFPDGTTTNVQTGNLNVDPIIVTPTLPFIVDNNGWKNDSCEAPADNDEIDYTLVYNQRTGEWKLDGTVKRDDMVFVGSDQKNWTIGGVLGVNEIVTSDNVEVSDNPGWLDDNVTPPADNEMVTYELEYDQKTGEWVLIAKTKDGFEFEGNLEEIKTEGKLNVDPVVVSPEDPTIVDNDGYNNDSVVSPDDNNLVDYELNYDQKTGEWTLTAVTAREDHIFPTGEREDTKSGNLDVTVKIDNKNDKNIIVKKKAVTQTQKEQKTPVGNTTTVITSSIDNRARETVVVTKPNDNTKKAAVINSGEVESTSNLTTLLAGMLVAGAGLMLGARRRNS